MIGMKVALTINELELYIKAAGNSLPGFVPTMGALHEGHLSLVRKAITDFPLVVVSIFVNPNQFNDKNDLKNYPRTPERDCNMLAALLRENDIVFMPDVKEIYPSEDTRVFTFGNLDKVMEAQHRKGHFNGVAQVVSRLFEIVKPHTAYFGQKDFQQLAVIKNLVRQLELDIKIIPCPIVREPDGLAMSSRNVLLEPAIRNNAPAIFRTISEAAGMISNYDIPEIKEYVRKSINSNKGLELLYFEIADDVDLYLLETRSQMRSDRKYFGCIAVKAGNIRLIDNIEIGLV
jgi:pantoate--beta-alanine ligase